MAPETPPTAAAKKPAVKKKPKGSAAPVSKLEAPKPIASSGLSEADAKKELDRLQHEYGALLVNFNNQQIELKNCQEKLKLAEDQLEQFEKGNTDQNYQTLQAVRPAPCSPPQLSRSASCTSMHITRLA